MLSSFKVELYRPHTHTLHPLVRDTCQSITSDDHQSHLYGSVKEKHLNHRPVISAKVAMVKGNASLHCLTELLILKLACSTIEGSTLWKGAHKAVTATRGKEEGGRLLCPFA